MLREKKQFDDAVKAEAKKALDDFLGRFKASLKDANAPTVEKAAAAAAPPPPAPAAAH
jgi:hypothetical protein